jgi:hypothetical protein
VHVVGAPPPRDVLGQAGHVRAGYDKAAPKTRRHGAIGGAAERMSMCVRLPLSGWSERVLPFNDALYGTPALVSET